jgi:hypothetical protein
MPARFLLFTAAGLVLAVAVRLVSVTIRLVIVAVRFVTAAIRLVVVAGGLLLVLILTDTVEMARGLLMGVIGGYFGFAHETHPFYVGVIIEYAAKLSMLVPLTFPIKNGCPFDSLEPSALVSSHS